VVVSLNFRKRQAVSKAKQHNFQVLFSGLQTMKGTAVFRIDIAKKTERKNLEDILLFMDCIFDCHFAPPCGTASAARQMKPGLHLCVQLLIQWVSSIGSTERG
jgi:hypothetical protein